MPVSKSGLKGLIEIELNQSHDGWKGKGVKIERTQYRANEFQRYEVNQIGRAHGCHTCLKKINSDSDQPWIGDHIPPTELKLAARVNLGCSDETVLFPQCDVCAHEQAGLVKALNMNPSKSLTPKEKKLINGGWPPKLWSNCVSSSGARVNSEEGKNVQRLGVKLGCHSCGSSYPASVYIADHIFPAEFCTSYMEKVFALLDLDYESYFELRPQCPKCSCCQGGNVAHIAKLAREFAAENDIVVYK